MAESSERGLLVTTKTITTLVAVFTLLSALFMGVTTINGYAYRINQLEAERIEMVDSLKVLNAKIDELSKQIVALTITLSRLEDRYGQLTRGTN